MFSSKYDQLLMGETSMKEAVRTHFFHWRMTREAMFVRVRVQVWAHPYCRGGGWSQRGKDANPGQFLNKSQNVLKYKDGAEEKEAESESCKRSCWGA